MTERRNEVAKGRKVSMNTKPPASDIAAWLKSTERQVRRVGDSRSAVLRRRFDHALDAVWAACTTVIIFAAGSAA
jgi:hypothetical protein